MDFRSISSVQSYVKTLDSKYQAEKQQEEGPAVSTDPVKKQSKLDEWIKQRQDEMKSAIETMKRMEESTDYKLAGIQSKVYSGTSLSQIGAGSISRQRIRCCTRALRQLIWRKRSMSAS